MLISKFPKYIFWSYKKNADLADEVIIKQVSLYGEIKDLVLLSNLYSKELISQAIIKFKTSKNLKRINFIEKVILG